MVALTALWLPILLSAIAIFGVSSVIHMILPWHKSDFRRFASEEEVLSALRKFDLAPGDYAAPMPDSTADLASAEYRAKVERGPQIVMTVMSPGNSMGVNLIKWFIYLVVVGVFVAYVTGAMLGPGADYMDVFRLTSTVAFAGFALGIWQNWIWYSRDLGAVFRSTIDGLIYALLTGGIFGWLWP